MSIKIYYLSSEINPFSQTSSLATFSKEFSTIINNEKTTDIRLIHPKYGYISDRRYILREVIRLKDLTIKYCDEDHLINLKSGFIPGTKVQIYFMEHNEYFQDISELLYKSKNGRIYKNNNEKFTFFSIAAFETLKKLYWIPDIIIYNDWQMSMAPLIINKKYSDILSKTKKIFFVHSINQLYHFETKIYKKLNLKVVNNEKKQNNLIHTIKNSDFTFFFNDQSKSISNYIKKNKNINKLLKKSNHSIIDYDLNMDTSQRIEIYNDILLQIKNIK